MLTYYLYHMSQSEINTAVKKVIQKYVNKKYKSVAMGRIIETVRMSVSDILKKQEVEFDDDNIIDCIGKYINIDENELQYFTTSGGTIIEKVVPKKKQIEPDEPEESEEESEVTKKSVQTNKTNKTNKFKHKTNNYRQQKQESEDESDPETDVTGEDEPHKKMVRYQYPKERKYGIIIKTGQTLEQFLLTVRLKEAYEPHGTQWIRESIQKDDPWRAMEKKLFETVKKLRAIEYPQQRSPEWFAQREGRITASDAGCVVGLNDHEHPFKFIIKKVANPPFEHNRYCYHGKKFETIACMIYAYRTNVVVDEYGLVNHPKYTFLAASPDGIVAEYKFDKVHKTKNVGKMLEIKCPLSRQIQTSGKIYGEIVPTYYWAQVQNQLECCDLEECDFWQCDIEEYSSRKDFINDTDPNEPFRSLTTGFEKGCIIQMVPLAKMADVANGKYDEVCWEGASHIYPSKIEMTPYECDLWVAEKMAELGSDPKYKDVMFDRVIYWRLRMSKCVTITRDREWFQSKLPIYRKMWNYVLYFRSNPKQFEKLQKFIGGMKRTNNDKIMEYVEKLYGEGSDEPENEENEQNEEPEEN